MMTQGPRQMMPQQMGQMMNQVPRQMMMMQRTSVPNSMQQVSAGQPLPPVLRTSEGIYPSHSVSYGSPGQAGVPGASPMRRPSGSSAASQAADRPITPRTPWSSQCPLTPGSAGHLTPGSAGRQTPGQPTTPGHPQPSPSPDMNAQRFIQPISAISPLAQQQQHHHQKHQQQIGRPVSTVQITISKSPPLISRTPLDLSGSGYETREERERPQSHHPQLLLHQQQLLHLLLSQQTTSHHLLLSSSSYHIPSTYSYAKPTSALTATTRPDDCL